MGYLSRSVLALSILLIFPSASRSEVFRTKFNNSKAYLVLEILDDEERPGAAVDQLVFQLARGVERVDIHRDEPRPQDPRQNGAIADSGVEYPQRRRFRLQR